MLQYIKVLERQELHVKIKKSDKQKVDYPSKKLLSSLALGVALCTTACTSDPRPKTDHAADTTQKQVGEPENLGGIPPVVLLDIKNTGSLSSCDINTSKPGEIKHPSALAGKIVAPRR